jgi:hypothetical protein
LEVRPFRFRAHGCRFRGLRADRLGCSELISHLEEALLYALKLRVLRERLADQRPQERIARVVDPEVSDLWKGRVRSLRLSRQHQVAEKLRQVAPWGRMNASLQIDQPWAGDQISVSPSNPRRCLAKGRVEQQGFARAEVGPGDDAEQVDDVLKVAVIHLLGFGIKEARAVSDINPGQA